MSSPEEKLCAVPPSPEARYRALLELATDGVLIAAPGGVIVDANDSLCAMAGARREDLVGRRLGDALFSPETLGEKPFRKDLLEKGETVVAERAIRRADGTEVIVEMRTKMLAGGHVLSMFRDVTRRVKTEAALKESEEKYRLFVQETHDGITLIDEDGKVIIWNKRLEQMTGVPAADVLGRPHWDVAFEMLPRNERTEERRERIRGAVKRSLETGVPPFEGFREIRSMREDGVPVWFEQTTFVIGTERGFKFGAINRDITERKQLEEEARAEGRFVHAVFENVHDGILVMDVRTRKFVMANGAICRMLGYTREEILTFGVEDIHPPDKLDKVINTVRRQERGEISLAADIPVLRKDGSIFVADINSTSAKIFGKPCLVGMFRDVTERRKLNEQLLQAQKLESLGSLAGGIAHDFNNLLGGVFGCIELSRLSRDPSRAALFLDQAMGAIDRARSLTRQLVTFAKGGTPAKRTELLSPFLEESTQFALSGSSCRAHFEIPAGLWPCNFDRHQIVQVIDNLVRNAQQAMPEGGTITVRARNVPCGFAENGSLLDEAPYVAVSIADEGDGIPEAHRSRIFDPFFTTKARGHGLGLTTSYSIVKQHGGAIALESELGRGSVFTVYLPAAAECASDGVGVDASSDLERRRILVLDDEDLVASTLRDMLAALGYYAVCASRGVDAIEAFRRAATDGAPFDAAFLDLTLPGGMSGDKVAREIRRLDGRVPLFMLSGYADSPFVAEPQKHGFTASMSKPFTIRDLVELLTAHLPPAKP